MKEATVQKWIKDTLVDEFGDSIYIFKAQSGPYSSRRGIPDWVACIFGKFYGIEVKTDQGKLTKLQSLEINKINKSGGFAFTIYGKDKAVMGSFIRRIHESRK